MHAPDGPRADADVPEPPAVVIGRVALQDGGRVGPEGGDVDRSPGTQRPRASGHSPPRPPRLSGGSLVGAL